MGAEAAATDVDVVGASTSSTATETASETADTAGASPERITLRAVLEAGFVAGMVFLALEVLTGIAGASTPMGPARASIKGVFGVAPGQLTVGGTVGTLGVHFALALLTTLALGRMVHFWKTYVAVPIGLAFGGFLYTANVVLLSAVAPNATIGSGLGIIVNYALFGLVAAWIYKVRQ